MSQTTVSKQTEIQNLMDLRTFAYDVLRRVFLEEPSKELVTQLQDGVLANIPFRNENEQLRKGLEQVEKYFSDFQMERDYESLHWDYTRMFIGPYELPAPIWESSYLNKEGLLFQEETLRVRRFYLEYCFETLQYGREADDHLGLELDFMYQLNLIAIDCLKNGNIDTFRKTLSDQHYFVKEHLLKWTPLFGKNVLKHAETDFYKGMVNILNGFLTIEQQCLDEVLAIEM